MGVGLELVSEWALKYIYGGEEMRILHSRINAIYANQSHRVFTKNVVYAADKVAVCHNSLSNNEWRQTPRSAKKFS